MRLRPQPPPHGHPRPRLTPSEGSNQLWGHKFALPHATPLSPGPDPGASAAGGPHAESVRAAAPRVPSTATRGRPLRRPSSVQSCHCLSLVPVRGSPRLAFPLPSFLGPQDAPASTPCPRLRVGSGRTSVRGDPGRRGSQSEGSPVREDPAPSGGCGRAGGGCTPDPRPGRWRTRVLPAGRARGPRRPGPAQVQHLPGLRPSAAAPGTEGREPGHEGAGRAPPSPAPPPAPHLKRQSPGPRAPTPPPARGARRARAL